jgi:hypothetical protein
VAMAGGKLLAGDQMVDGQVVGVDHSLGQAGGRGGERQSGGGCRQGDSLKDFSALHGYDLRTLARASFMMGP